MNPIVFDRQQHLYKNPAFSELVKDAVRFFIYVGKAVPTGWRQARITANALNQSRELHNRLREHARSIAIADGLLVEEFMCRFVIFEAGTSDMIATIEAALIKLNQPLWNVAVDGFGNHDPGRAWADRCIGKSKDKSLIVTKIARYFDRPEGEA